MLSHPSWEAEGSATKKNRPTSKRKKQHDNGHLIRKGLTNELPPTRYIVMLKKVARHCRILTHYKTNSQKSYDRVVQIDHAKLFN
jgi:hypothetical protein